MRQNDRKSTERQGIHVVESDAAREAGDAALEDDALMLLVRSGNKEAFAALIRRHQAVVIAFAARYLNSRTLARDVAQDVFLALWRERARYEPRGTFRALLITMTRNRCNTLSRNRRLQEARLREAEQGAAPDTAAGLPLDVVLARERDRLLRAGLAELPDKIRTVMTLRYGLGLPTDEIAEVTGMPLGTVKPYLQRGVERLRRLLAKEGS